MRHAIRNINFLLAMLLDTEFKELDALLMNVDLPVESNGEATQKPESIKHRGPKKEPPHAVVERLNTFFESMSESNDFAFNCYEP